MSKFETQPFHSTFTGNVYSQNDQNYRDRNRQSWLDNLRESSPSPPALKGHIDPESTLNFLQELDSRFLALGMFFFKNFIMK